MHFLFILIETFVFNVLLRKDKFNYKSRYFSSISLAVTLLLIFSIILNLYFVSTIVEMYYIVEDKCALLKESSSVYIPSTCKHL